MMSNSRNRIGVLLSGVFSLGIGFAQAESLDAVVEMERQDLSQDCSSLEFQDGFVSEVDVNGDSLDDVVADYGQMVCDGMNSMFCGSGGCTQTVYVQEAQGRFQLIGRFLTYGISFDRPQEASFLVSSHGGACGRSGHESCHTRFAWRNGTLENLGAEEP